MKCSTGGKITHSYARIVFVLGEPLANGSSSSEEEAGVTTTRWQCGCRSTGPLQAMDWNSCSAHVEYTAVLSEESTSAILSRWEELALMRFGDYTATWSFDPSNTYCEKQFRDQYLSILYACGTPAGDFFGAELIYRELISNSLHHAPGRVQVELQWSDPYPVLSVDDQWDLFFWSGKPPLNPFQERGRGLYLVKCFARELRIKDSPSRGYKIAAVLPVERKREITDLFDFADR
jgi:hypothetical protein